MASIHAMQPLTYRSVWVSDVHLGSKACRAEFLLDFLKSVECEQLYLVGDIVDLWAMKKNMFWPQSHNDVVRAILKKGERGTRITYIPGNHDSFMRDHEGASFGAVKIQNEAIHVTADGRRLWVLHGDEFDSVVHCGRIMNLIGCGAYEGIIWLNRLVNFLRRKCGFPYWSLASYLKHRVKSAAKFMVRYENAVVTEAKRLGVDGVICGHVHRDEIHHVDNVLYCNDGDWVENCTALVETFDGCLKLVHWADHKHMIKDIAPRTQEEVSAVA